MTRSRIGTFSVIGMVSLVLSGCETDTNSLGSNFDLADYLFPSRSGTLVYHLYRSEKPENENTFSDETYQNEVRYTVKRGNKLVVITNAGLPSDSIDLMIESDSIAIDEKESRLNYHFDRNVSSTDNFVQESIVKNTVESAGKTTITYECNVTEHIDSVQIEPSPKQYKDILKLMCVRRKTIHAAVGGKLFQTIKETQEEKQLARGIGMINSKVTTCEYTAVDSHEQEEGGCTRNIYKIWTFVESDTHNKVLATSSNQ